MVLFVSDIFFYKAISRMTAQSFYITLMYTHNLKQPTCTLYMLYICTYIQYAHVHVYSILYGHQPTLGDVKRLV